MTIETRVPVCLEKYDFIEHMGRFTLRDEGRTIAMGKVLRYKPAVIKKTEDDAEEKEKLLEKIKQTEQEKSTNLAERSENQEESKQDSTENE